MLYVSYIIFVNYLCAEYFLRPSGVELMVGLW